MFDKEEFENQLINEFDLVIVPENIHGQLPDQASKESFFLYYSEKMSTLPKNVANVLQLIQYKTQLIETQQQLLQQHDNSLLFDQLTGCFNRQQLNEFIHKTHAICKRNKSKFALLLINVDNFKSLNNIYGFLQGDQVVKTITQRLLSKLRESDVLSRTDGDEFAVLLTEISESNDAGKIAQKIIDSLSQPYHVQNQYIDISVSIGIACYPNASDNVIDFLRYADIALTKAQEKGRGINTFQFYSEQLNKDYCARTKIEMSLKETIANKKLSLNFQPQIELKSNQIIGLESLCRWNHPELGFVSPDIFIPIAERLSLIDELGFWVLKESCLLYKKLSSKYKLDPNFVIAVNVSPFQLKNPNFATESLIIIKSLEVPPTAIEFELTESSFTQEQEQLVIKILHQLKDSGIHLAIDDYGTGYSSLGRLCQLPVSRLKMDKSFVWKIGEDSSYEKVIESTVNLAKGLNLTVVAEGVENQIHVDFLDKINCDYMQGYFYYKPLPREELEKIFQKENN